jgi:hypothetical protein
MLELPDNVLPEQIDGLPNLCGAEDQIRAAMRTDPAGPGWSLGNGLDQGQECLRRRPTYAAAADACRRRGPAYSQYSQAQ